MADFINQEQHRQEMAARYAYYMKHYVEDTRIANIKVLETSDFRYVLECNGSKAIVEFDPDWYEYVYTVNGQGPFAHSSYEFISRDIVDTLAMEERAVIKVIQEVAAEVVKEYDWTMPKYDQDEYGDRYDEYENDCLDIGHERRSEICGVVIKRLIDNGTLVAGDDSYYQLIDEEVWDVITTCIVRNQDKDPDAREMSEPADLNERIAAADAQRTAGESSSSREPDASRDDRV